MKQVAGHVGAESGRQAVSSFRNSRVPTRIGFVPGLRDGSPGLLCVTAEPRLSRRGSFRERLPRRSAFMEPV
jgi:hypothetical protein